VKEQPQAFSDYSFPCPNCGDWLPTPEAYEKFKGKMNQEHRCLCGQTHTKQPDTPPASRKALDELHQMDHDLSRTPPDKP
jgi:hypothetical protein